MNTDLKIPSGFSRPRRARKHELIQLAPKASGDEMGRTSRQSSSTTYRDHLRQEHEHQQIRRRLREAGGQAAVEDPDAAARHAKRALYGQRPPRHLLFATGLAAPATGAGAIAFAVFDTQSVVAMCVAAVLCTSAVIMAVLAGKQLLDHLSKAFLRLTERDFNGNFAYIPADSEGGKIAKECHRVVAAVCSADDESLHSLGHTRCSLLAWRDGLVVRAADLQHDLDTLDEVESNISDERAHDVQSVRTQARDEMEALRAEVRELDTRAHTYREIADQFTARGDDIVRRADDELVAEHKQRRAEATLFEIARKRHVPERKPGIAE